MDAALEVHAFSVALGSKEVLARVSLTLRPGEIQIAGLDDLEAVNGARR